MGSTLLRAFVGELVGCFSSVWGVMPFLSDRPESLVGVGKGSGRWDGVEVRGRRFAASGGRSAAAAGSSGRSRSEKEAELRPEGGASSEEDVEAAEEIRAALEPDDCGRVYCTCNGPA